ncbi:MAG TPA: hypothetical protein VH208_12890, partial [Myxococcaceae bacterium]|nr:hypothetical protein [Myxococcaceae bacterium]
AARLSQLDQERLVEVLADRKRLTGADVEALRHVERAAAVDELFAALGPDPEAAPPAEAVPAPPTALSQITAIVEAWRGHRIPPHWAMGDVAGVLAGEQPATPPPPDEATTWQSRALAHILAALAELPPELQNPNAGVTPWPEEVASTNRKAAGAVLERHGARLTSYGSWASPFPLLAAAAVSFGTPEDIALKAPAPTPA